MDINIKVNSHEIEILHLEAENPFELVFSLNSVDF